MPGIFDFLKDLAKMYSFSIQDLLKDLLSGKQKGFSYSSGSKTNYYQNILKNTVDKIHQLQAELKEYKKLKKKLEKLIEQEIINEKTYQQYEEDYEKYFEDDDTNYKKKWDDKIAKYYAALEVPYGSDWDTVKKSYRRLMKKYHPDFYTNEPEKQQTSKIVAQKLSEAYHELEEYLKKK